jgi:SOS-response transcriptional repressor LexA
MKERKKMVTNKKGKARAYDYEAILNWIIRYKIEHDGLSPTMQQIATACGLKTMSHVAYILNTLEKDQRIILTPGGIQLPHSMYRSFGSDIEMITDFVIANATQLQKEVRLGDTTASEITRVYGDATEYGFDDQTIEKIIELIQVYNVQSAIAPRL